MPGRGIGRGGRGIRMAEALQKMQTPQLGGDDSSSQPSGSGASSPVSSQCSSPEPNVIPSIGGRGKLKQYILTKQESSASSSGSASPEPALEGAVGGISRLGISRGAGAAQPEPSRERPREVAIENKAIGSEGRELNVCVNYVRVSRQKDKGIYEYHVDFEPSIDSRKIRHLILKSDDIKEVIGGVFEFTGMNIYLPIKLPDNRTVATGRSPTTQEAITVTITYVKQPPFEELIPFFNTTFRRIMHILRLVQINRHYYDPSCRIEIPQHKLEIWPGSVTTIAELDGGLMLNCDVSYRILRTNTARDVLQEIISLPDGKAKFKDLAHKKLVGTVVLTKYNNKPYRVDDISFDLNPDKTFTLSSGREISYVDYFKESWGVEIKDRRQPLLVNRPKPKKGETVSAYCLIAFS